MAGRVVVFGATGYTGRLVVESLLARGLRPVAAGRSADRLASLSAAHGGLETAVADVARPDTLRTLVGRGDVLVSTVGPFARHGSPAVEAAIAAGAHYVDSTGEASFIRSVFEQHAPRARSAGSALLTAFGYDYVPGNLAGALALREAGDGARRVDVGYFLSGAARMSSGTRATMLASSFTPHHAYRGGRTVARPAMRDVRTFTFDGLTLPAGSVGASEQFTLPRLAPRLQEVGVYLGWLGRAVRGAQAMSYVTPVVTRVPGVRGLLSRPVDRAMLRTGEGPDESERARSRSRFCAVALDGRGRELASARVEGVDGYTLTGRLIAAAAESLAAGAVSGTGALGPVDAFGLDGLEQMCRDAGLTTVEARRP